MANETRSERPMRERRRRKVCQFCVDKVEHIDYKDTAKLRKYISDRAKILPRRLIQSETQTPPGKFPEEFF